MQEGAQRGCVMGYVMDEVLYVSWVHSRGHECFHHCWAAPGKGWMPQAALPCRHVRLCTIAELPWATAAEVLEQTLSAFERSCNLKILL